MVLAGGLARRLGGAKAAIQLGGRALITYPVEALAAAGLEPIVIAKADTALPALEVPIWVEKEGCSHPAHGIASALERAGRPIVVCACDAPFLPPALLSLLADRDEPLVTLESTRGIEPLPGRYDPAVGERLAAAATDGQALQGALERLGPVRIAESELRRFGDPGRILFNINTAEDLERAEGLVQHDLGK